MNFFLCYFAKQFDKKTSAQTSRLIKQFEYLPIVMYIFKIGSFKYLQVFSEDAHWVLHKTEQLLNGTRIQ